MSKSSNVKKKEFENFDISSFFQDDDDNASEGDIVKDNFKKTLYNLTTNQAISLLQYSAFMEFEKVNGCICNIDWFIDDINNMSKNTKISADKLIEVKKTASDAYKKFFRYKDDEFRLSKDVQYNLTRLDTIDLTAEQKKAMKLLLDFLMDRSRKVFGLYGYAGTGKTTTMVEFVSYLIINGYIKRIGFTAPTNKAVNVIKSKFKPHIKKISEKLFEKKIPDVFNFDEELEFLEQNGIKIDFMTIHKLLMFQTDYSVATGDTIFVRNNKKGEANSLIPEYDLIIIDECSMISIDMVDSVFDEIKVLTTSKIDTSTTTFVKTPKIIFTGDPAQLPPVNEEDSSIFCKSEDDLPFETYLEIMRFKGDQIIISDAEVILKRKYQTLIANLQSMKTFLLKTVVRSRIGNVTRVCNEIRNWIYTDSLPDLAQFLGCQGVNFFEFNGFVDKIKTSWFESFIESIKSGNTSIILTWTNRQTDIYNDTIRKKMFKKENQKIKKFEIGDILMLSDFYSLDRGEDHVSHKLYTSEQIKIISTMLTVVPVNKFEQFTNSTIRKMKTGVKVEDKINMLIEGLNQKYCQDLKINAWVLTVHKLGEDPNETITIVVVDDVDYDRYTAIKTETNNIIKNFAKQMITQYKTAPKQIEKAVIIPIWKQWRRIFMEPFANVNYGYSITCHKAQGSNLFDVFVDLHDILQNSKSIESKKCAYTAVTRAVNELYILI